LRRSAPPLPLLRRHREATGSGDLLSDLDAIRARAERVRDDPDAWPLHEFAGDVLTLLALVEQQRREIASASSYMSAVAEAIDGALGEDDNDWVAGLRDAAAALAAVEATLAEPEVGGGYAYSVTGDVVAGSTLQGGAAVNPRGSVTSKQDPDASGSVSAAEPPGRETT
jgi:hypothetical protein